MAMAFSTGMAQQTRQSQTLALTQQRLLSMEILQLQQLDLEQRLDAEINQNPALERLEFADDPDDDPSPVDNDPDDDARFDVPPPDGDTPYGGGDGGDNPLRDARVESDAPFDPDGPGDVPADDSFTHEDDIDGQWDAWHDDDDYAPRRERGAPGSGAGDDDERFDPLSQLTAPGPSFLDHLIRQLHEDDLAPRERLLAEGIVQRLDPDGWLRTPLVQTVPGHLTPPPDGDELERALECVQRLDPPGVGARDARECLALQLARRDAGDDPAALATARAIVDGELDHLAANRLPLIAKHLDRSMDEVKRAAALIRTCRPDPAADYAPPPTMAVRPDLCVEAAADGEGFTVRLPGGRARAEISDFWMALFERTRRARILRDRFLADPATADAFAAMRDQLKADPESAKRYRQLYDNASGLMKAVAMREQTLLRVAEAIVRAQTAYLAGEADAPAPLLMQDIARRVGYDESTISRTVKDKYAETPRGVLPLRSFFARGAAETDAAGGLRDTVPSPGADDDGEGGEGGSGGVSAQHVINRLRELIEGEDRKKPLRDNELLDRLNAEGFKLARRTVANYRAQLGYPSHSRRREY